MRVHALIALVAAGCGSTVAATPAHDFEITLAAQNDFLKRIGGSATASGGRRVELEMGKVESATLLSGSWTGGYDVHSWDPSKVDAAQLETLPLEIAPLERSSNAFLNY